jgi:DNA-binding transcriptional regulator YiaG
MTFGEELKDWRARIGWTREQAAAYLKMSPRTLQEWEQDRAKPNQIEQIRFLMELKIANETGQ